MTDFDASTEAVLEIIKQYITDIDASYLAKEDVVVFWGKLPDEPNISDWITLKLDQVARIIKTSRCPYALMNKCKKDLVLVAFQELERSYSQGSYSVNPKKGVFSFKNRVPEFECPYRTLVVRLFNHLEHLGMNIKLLDLRDIIVESLIIMGEEIPSRTKMNKQINQVVREDTSYEVRMYEKRFVWEGAQLTGYTKKDNYLLFDNNERSRKAMIDIALGKPSGSEWE